MSSGIIFDADSSKRIANATRGWEQMQGAPEPITYQADNSYGRMMLVRTRSTLPSGYTGAMAALGDVIEKQPDGTVSVIGQVWIKDINGGTLSANTIYQARIGGTYTQDVTTNGIVTPTTLGLYLVQGAGGSSLGSGSFITGKIGFNYNGSATILYYYNAQNIQISYTLINIHPNSWQVRTVQRFGCAVVVDSAAQTANLIFFTPIVFAAECQKTSLYTAKIVNGNVPIIDPLSLSYHYATYGYFNALLFDMGQPGFDPVVGMVTNSNWAYGTGSNPFWPYGTAPTTSGISTGIGSGISGV